MNDLSCDAHQIANELRLLPVVAADDQKVLATNTIAEINGRLHRCFESHRENADAHARARRSAGPIRVAGRSYPSGHDAAIGEAYSLLDRLWFYLDPEGREQHFQFDPDHPEKYDPRPTAWHAGIVADDWPQAKAVILDRLNDQWRQDFSEVPAQVETEAADLKGKTPAGIPPEYRTKPIPKTKAAKLLGRTNTATAVKWLNQCIEDGTIACESRTRQSFVFDIRDFPESVHAKLKGD